MGLAFLEQADEKTESVGRRRGEPDFVAAFFEPVRTYDLLLRVGQRGYRSCPPNWPPIRKTGRRLRNSPCSRKASRSSIEVAADIGEIVATDLAVDGQGRLRPAVVVAVRCEPLDL